MAALASHTFCLCALFGQYVCYLGQKRVCFTYATTTTAPPPSSSSSSSSSPSSQRYAFVVIVCDFVCLQATGATATTVWVFAVLLVCYGSSDFRFDSCFIIYFQKSTLLYSTLWLSVAVRLCAGSTLFVVCALSLYVYISFLRHSSEPLKLTFH